MPTFTGPNNYTDVTKEELMGYHKQMVRIRRMETKASQMYTQKKIRGFCHLYIGQEAICVGAESSLTFKDAIITAYRDHAWHLTRVPPPPQVAHWNCPVPGVLDAR